MRPPGSPGRSVSGVVQARIFHRRQARIRVGAAPPWQRRRRVRDAAGSDGSAGHIWGFRWVC